MFLDLNDERILSHWTTLASPLGTTALNATILLLNKIDSRKELLDYQSSKALVVHMALGGFVKAHD